MGRRIITTELQAAGAGPELDTYFDKLIKYIPADVIAAWTVAMGLISGAENIPKDTIRWIVFVVCLIATALWTLRNTSETGKPPAITQTALSTIAFGVWVFALGGPFVALTWYAPVYGSLLLLAYTLFVPLVPLPEE